MSRSFIWFLWIVLVLCLSIPIALLVGVCYYFQGSIWEVFVICGMLWVIWDMGKTVVTRPPWKV